MSERDEEPRGILKLPCELIARIFRLMDSVQDILSPRLACRYLNDSYLQYSDLAHAVLSREIGPDLLPYAVAAFLCSRPTADLEVCWSVLDDLHREPENLEFDAQEISVAVMTALSKRHQIIHGLAMELAENAWTKLGKPPPLCLSVAESRRFHIAFYRFDLIGAFMRAHFRSLTLSFMLESAKSHLTSRYTPWANEQVACVHDFLLSAFMKAVRETVAHEVDFGEFRVDYLDYGCDNYWMQSRLSRGIEYINELLETKALEDQAALLQSRRDDPGDTTVFDIICSELDEEALDDDTVLENYSAQELAALARFQDPTDPDTGPYEAWYPAHKQMWRNGFVMFGAEDGLRERAYVFWDSERLHQYDLLKTFEDVEQYVTHPYDEAEHQAMEHSFDERSKIWQKGGSGFWYEGDESRIVWPAPRKQGNNQ